MAVRIRLRRQGRKGKPFYHIIAADARAPRDGRYIERLGSYNPNTQPATIELDIEKAVKWLQNGAETSDTARAILSYKGALYKNHLLNGVRKGAFDEAEAEKRYEAWKADKEARISGHSDSLRKAEEADKAKRLAAEKEVNEAREAAVKAAEAEAMAAQKAEEDAAAAAAAAETASEEATEAAEAEAPKAEAEAETPEAAAEESKAEEEGEEKAE